MKLTSRSSSIVAFTLIAAVAAGATLWAQQESESKPVVRVKRPKFHQRDWDGIFFENLFAEGLQGERPPQLGAPADANASMDSSNDVEDRPPVASSPWSEVIDAAVIEDEVKRLQLLLNQQITTPTKFETDHNQIRHSFAMLSTLFAIIREYDSDVRWKEHAPAAQAAFAQAAANARTASQQSYAYAKRRREDLAELVRGGAFPESADNEPITDWSMVVDRIPIMNRLSSSTSEKLKPMTSSDTEIEDNLEDIVHEASLVAALGRVLASPGMMDADDESYNEMALEMARLGAGIRSAAIANDFSTIAEQANLINQSCDDCHNEWR